MRRSSLAILAMTTLLAVPAAATAQDASPAADATAEDASWLFVVSGTSGSADGTTLTLEGVPGLVAFTDRPDRVAGLLPLSTAESGPASFTGDPPNAVLSVFAEDTVFNIALELTSLEDREGGSVSIGYALIAGRLPVGEFGPASLFIDGASPCEGMNPQQCLLDIQLATQDMSQAAAAAAAGMSGIGQGSEGPDEDGSP